MKKILFLLPFFCAVKLNAQFCFSQSYNNGTGTAPYGICNADFNNDGFVDLAGADGNLAVHIWLGNGSGGFTPWVNIGAGNTPEGIITADFNADGNADLATANYNSNNISIFIGNG